MNSKFIRDTNRTATISSDMGDINIIYKCQSTIALTIFIIHYCYSFFSYCICMNSEVIAASCLICRHLAFRCKCNSLSNLNFIISSEQFIQRAINTVWNCWCTTSGIENGKNDKTKPETQRCCLRLRRNDQSEGEHNTHRLIMTLCDQWSDIWHSLLNVVFVFMAYGLWRLQSMNS